MNLRKTEMAMALSLVAIALTFATIAPSLGNNAAEAAVDKVHLEKLKIAHQKVTEKMVKQDMDIPAFITYVDEQTGELVVGIDDLKTKKSAEEFRPALNELFGEVLPIKLYSGHFEETACSSRTSTCRPLVGGILINTTLNGGTAGTLTFGVTNNAGKKGFITAAHLVGWGSTAQSVGQPTTEIIGKVITNPSGTQRQSDAAFVEFSKDIFGFYKYSATENSVWKSSTSNYKFFGKTSSGSTLVGANMRFHGEVSGEKTGTIAQKGVTVSSSGVTRINQVAATAIPVAGDSGAPVTSNCVSPCTFNFFGIISGKTVCTAPCTVYGIYSPWQGIRDELGVS